MIKRIATGVLLLSLGYAAGVASPAAQAADSGERIVQELTRIRQELAGIRQAMGRR